MEWGGIQYLAIASKQLNSVPIENMGRKKAKILDVDDLQRE